MKIHFMGIGGSGISAVARIARDLGHQVTGCDLEEGPMTTRLRREGIPVEIGHSTVHMKGFDLLVHSSAVFYQSDQNPEFRLGVKKKIAMTGEEYMKDYLMKGMRVVAVTGTHGKGTTTAMLGRILEAAGQDPTVFVGANLLDWGKKNYRVGKGKDFILEADEFRDKFFLYKPDIAVVTSIEMDHPEYFEDFEAVLSSFKKFVSKAKIVIACADLKKYKLAKKVIYYRPVKFKLRFPGDHIKSDAGAAWAAARVLKVKNSVIKKALKNFGGLERRFELRGDMGGVRIYDDYAHHPTAVVANIKAARELFPKSQIWVVLQPHMYSRMGEFFAGFAKALRMADRAVVTDVYTRREKGLTKPTSKELALAAGPTVTYVGGDLINVGKFVERNTKKGDVVLVLGAGDVYKVSDYLLSSK